MNADRDVRMKGAEAGACGYTRTAHKLTMLLARRVMEWRVGPHRFQIRDRRWIPSWRFQPTEKIEDAFRLLEMARPQTYSICGNGGAEVCVRVQIGAAIGEACETSASLNIAYAASRAVGIETEE